MKFSTVLIVALLAFTAFSMVFTRPVETEKRLEMTDVPGAQSGIQSGGHPEIREFPNASRLAVQASARESIRKAFQLD